MLPGSMDFYGQYNLHVFHAEVWNLMENNKDSIRMQFLLCQRGRGINQNYIITSND